MYYRFLIDGIYRIDVNNPNEISNGILFNTIAVSSLPTAIGDIQTLSLQELQDFDSKLCKTIKTEPKNMKLSKEIRNTAKNSNKNRFNRKTLESIIKIQAFIRGRLQRTRYIQNLVKSKTLKMVDIGVNTDQKIVIDLEKEKLKLQILKLLKENDNLSKEIEK